MWGYRGRVPERTRWKLEAVSPMSTGSKAETYKKNLQLCLSEVSYMGHRLMKDGLGIGPAKVKAITDMPRPNSKKAIEHCLGCLCICLDF